VQHACLWAPLPWPLTDLRLSNTPEACFLYSDEARPEPLGQPVKNADRHDKQDHDEHHLVEGVDPDSLLKLKPDPACPDNSEYSGGTKILLESRDTG